MKSPLASATRMKLRERISRKATNVKSERPGGPLQRAAPLSENLQNQRQLRSASKSKKMTLASQPPLPLRAFMNAPSARKSRGNNNSNNGENIDPNANPRADKTIGHEKAKSKSTMLLGLKKTLKGTASAKTKERFEKLPKKSTAKLEWLLRRRASLPEESVLRAFQMEGVTAQLGKDCLEQMTRNSTNDDVQCQYLELVEALLAIEQNPLDGQYRLIQDLASPAMIDHLYERLGKCTAHVKIQQYTTNILGYVFHLGNVLKDTLTRLNENLSEIAIAPLVRAMEAYPDDDVVQKNAVKLLYQYIYFPGCHASGALAATPGCMEALAVVSNNSLILASSPHYFRTTTHKIFSRLVAYMAHNVEQLEVGKIGKKEHLKRKIKREKVYQDREARKNKLIHHHQQQQKQEEEQQHLRSLQQHFRVGSHQCKLTYEI